MEDPWFVSHLPDQPAQGAMPYMGMGPDMGSYAAPYPQDQLSQIKMRNRRFQQSCAQEQGAPMMRGPMMAPPQMMMQPQMTEDMMMMGGMQDELAMIDQDLNMTRRATRFNVEEFLSADQLPAPKKLGPKAPQEPEAPKPAPRREVGIADQIAIRSYVLGKSIGKTSDCE